MRGERDPSGLVGGDGGSGDGGGACVFVALFAVLALFLLQVAAQSSQIEITRLDLGAILEFLPRMAVSSLSDGDRAYILKYNPYQILLHVSIAGASALSASLAASIAAMRSFLGATGLGAMLYGSAKSPSRASAKKLSSTPASMFSCGSR